ncbi:MAG: signal recognition particle-docking protein FtsY [Eubacteriaceae bacterium]|nr:signal recognition particle-docking protein FtsY [Eubacteriaceae bacterium]
MRDKWVPGFLKTKKALSDRIKEAFTGKIDEDLYEELIESLVIADVPFALAESIIEDAKHTLSRSSKGDEQSVKDAVKQSVLGMLANAARPVEVSFPAIILVSGVNGVGKTTSIAKLAYHYKEMGKSVLLAAADTFRAAASEQLQIWAERVGVPIISSQSGQDAAGIVFDAVTAAKARNSDLLICDTAGRLHNKKNLISELEKIYRVLNRNKEGYSLYSLLVLDAMSGQNTMSQLESFAEAQELSGIILTKTDSSAKGGILIPIALNANAPVWFVGTGEGLTDLEPFDAVKFVDAIL